MSLSNYRVIARSRAPRQIFHASVEFGEGYPHAPGSGIASTSVGTFMTNVHADELAKLSFKITKLCIEQQCVKSKSP